MSTTIMELALMAVGTVASQEPTDRVVYPGGEGPGAGKHVVLVSGDEEYRSEEALPMLGKILSAHHGFDCTVLFAIGDDGTIDPDRRDRLPGLDLLAEADMLVLFTRFRTLPDEDMKHVVEYVESGRPILGIRTATHAFAYGNDSKSRYAHWSWNSDKWPGGFGKQVLGETWVNHHGRHGSESTRGVIPAARGNHPILRGVKDVWGPTDVYGIRSLPPDAVVLLEGSIRAGMSPGDPAIDDPRNDPRMPIAWARERAVRDGVRQRIVCSTIGAAIDLESEGLRRLFVNACYWGMGLESEIPDESRADVVGTYEPTMFGFGKFVKGVKPADHALEPAGR